MKERLLKANADRHKETMARLKEKFNVTDKQLIELTNQFKILLSAPKNVESHHSSFVDKSNLGEMMIRVIAISLKTLKEHTSIFRYVHEDLVDHIILACSICEMCTEDRESVA